MAQERYSFFTIPQIMSKPYKENMAQIVKGAKDLEQFTTRFQEKVDSFLQAQQNQFVAAYQDHMSKVKEQFTKLKQQLRKKQQIIIQYENQGEISTLFKRVTFLQGEEKKHLQSIEHKNKRIKELELDTRLNHSQIKRLQDKIKELIKTKTSVDEKLQISRKGTRNQSIPTYSSEISPGKSNDRLSKVLTQERSYNMRSLKSQISLNPQKQQSIMKLNKQLSFLKRQNKELSYVNTKFYEEVSEMEQFFIKTINEIKKNITVRKKIKQCSLEDFRKEDKLQLLIKILSDDTVTMHLHQAIFGKKKQPSSIEMKNQQQKFRKLKSAKVEFPVIKSTRI